MTISVEVTPEMQELLDRAMSTGEFSRPEDVISAALHLWYTDRMESPLPVEELNRICQEAISDTTPGIASDAAYAEMKDFCRNLEAEEHRHDAA
jgi:Arc/MetJ-type ribon-helix-helix transcriptional regulator